MRNPMEVQEILSHLERNEGHFARSAVREAVAHRDQIIPPLLEKFALPVKVRFNPFRDSAGCTIVMRWQRRLKSHFLMTKPFFLQPGQGTVHIFCEQLSPVHKSACNSKPKSSRQIERDSFCVGRNDLANYSGRDGLPVTCPRTPLIGTWLLLCNSTELTADLSSLSMCSSRLDKRPREPVNDRRSSPVHTEAPNKAGPAGPIG